MALVLKDRVKETTSSTGTGTITLAGAVAGFDSFAVVGDGNTTYYALVAQTPGEWEVGIGTYSASGGTLSRDSVLASSNSGSPVNFSAGVKDVFVTYPAGRAVTTVDPATLTNKTIDANENTILNLPVPAASDFQEFTTSGTWTKPAGAQFVMVEAWGAGGGGGSGRRGGNSNNPNSSSGGGGGSYTQRLFKAGDIGATETITVGAGGNGGAVITTNDTQGQNGSDGGNTSFGSLLVAYGGGGGSGAIDSVFGGVGAGVLSAKLSNTIAGAPADISGFGGAVASNSSSATVATGSSGWGGAGGGQGGSAGGSSFQGGAGGGCGQRVSLSLSLLGSSAGGSSSGIRGGGGAASTTQGVAGTNGSGKQGGGGGGGGLTMNAAKGGDGGLASGGGGGGSSADGFNSGAGGAGGNGLVRVYSW